MADAPLPASNPSPADIAAAPELSNVLNLSTARAAMFLRHARAEEMDKFAAQLAAVQAEMAALTSELDARLATRLNNEHVVWRDMTVLILTGAEKKLYRQQCPKSYSFDYGTWLLTSILAFEIDEIERHPALAQIFTKQEAKEFIRAVWQRRQAFIHDKGLPRWAQRQLANRARGSFDKILHAKPVARDLRKIYLRQSRVSSAYPDLSREGRVDVHHNLPQQLAQVASKHEPRRVARVAGIPLRPRCHNSPAVDRLDDGYTVAPNQPGLTLLRRDFHNGIIHDYLLDKILDQALKARGLSRRHLSLKGQSHPAKDRVVHLKKIPMFKRHVDITAEDEAIMALYQRYKAAQRQLAALHKTLAVARVPR